MRSTNIVDKDMKMTKEDKMNTITIMMDIMLDSSKLLTDIIRDKLEMPIEEQSKDLMEITRNTMRLIALLEVIHRIKEDSEIF